MKKVIITGAGGFIGSALSRVMAENGYKVYALIYDEREAENLDKHPNIIAVKGDLMRYEEIDARIDSDADMLIHLAWCGLMQDQKDGGEIQKRNIDMSLNAVALAKKKHCRRFVFTGTMNEHRVGRTEYSDTLSQACIYGTYKLCANKLCEVMTYNSMEYVSVAFTIVFGKGDRSDRTPNFFINRLLNGQPLDLIDGDNLYDWIYIDDAVRGILCAAEKGKSGKQYLISTGITRTFRQIIENVRDILAPDVALNFGKYHDNRYVDFTRFDTDALHDDTGFECTCDFRESVLKTAEWVRTLDL